MTKKVIGFYRQAPILFDKFGCFFLQQRGGNPPPQPSKQNSPGRRVTFQHRCCTSKSFGAGLRCRLVGWLVRTQARTVHLADRQGDAIRRKHSEVQCNIVFQILAVNCKQESSNKGCINIQAQKTKQTFIVQAHTHLVRQASSKVGRENNSPLAGTQRFPEPLLTKNELGTNSSSESESWVGWATPLPSNLLWLSLAGGEGGGEGDCSIGVDEADEQCKGGPVNHKHKTQTEKIKIYKGHKESQQKACTKGRGLSKQDILHIFINVPA